MSGIHLSPGETRIDRIVQAVRQLNQGRDDACGTVTLTPNATSTVVIAPNCSSLSKVQITATSLSAAVVTSYVSSKANGSFTITHSSSPAIDMTFDWEARG